MIASNEVKALCDFNIYTEKVIEARCPDVVLHQKLTKRVIDSRSSCTKQSDGTRKRTKEDRKVSRTCSGGEEDVECRI